jgi:hypothetical protein
MSIFPISASQVAMITGMSHQHPAWNFFEDKLWSFHFEIWFISIATMSLCF